MSVVAIAYLISRLNILRHPSAICWLAISFAFIAFPAGVMACGFYSIQSMLGSGSFPNVSNKVSKGSSPSIANTSPLATVKFEVVVFCPIAPSDHLGPNRIFPCLRESVLCFFNAAAAFDFSTAKVVCSDDFFGSALATAQPSDVMPGICLSAQNRKDTKYASREIIDVCVKHWSCPYCVMNEIVPTLYAGRLEISNEQVALMTVRAAA